MAIEKVPTAELESDLADVMADIVLCCKAIELGITDYKNDKGQMESVWGRLDGNRMVLKIIKGELEKRSQNN